MSAEARTIVCTADGHHWVVPQRAEELLEILEHARRYDEMPGLQLADDEGIVWINPGQVTAVRPLHEVQCDCCGEAC